jgi:hypothetical protein
MAGWREFAGTVLLPPAVSAIVAGFAAGSPVVGAVPDEDLRRLMTGALVAAAAAGIVYSPLGRISGAARQRLPLSVPELRLHPLRDRVQRLRRHHCSRREDRR